MIGGKKHVGIMSVMHRCPETDPSLGNGSNVARSLLPTGRKPQPLAPPGRQWQMGDRLASDQWPQVTGRLWAALSPRDRATRLPMRMKGRSTQL